MHMFCHCLATEISCIFPIIALHQSNNLNKINLLTEGIQLSQTGKKNKMYKLRGRA